MRKVLIGPKEAAMRKKIYYLLSNCNFLAPTSGDRINEMNIIRALCVNFDVYYNGKKVDPTNAQFGSRSDQILPPGPNYDLVYVRANKDIFLGAKPPKVWMASPYDYHCFKEADYVATFTPPWTEYLNEYNRNCLAQYFFQGMYPTRIPDVRALTVEQVLDDRFIPLRNHPKAQSIRQSVGGEFIIGHFGRVVESCYPHSFIAALSALKHEFPFVKFMCCGSLREAIPDGIIDFNKPFQFEDMPYAVSACDLIVYNQDLQGNFAGSMKVLEAIACGVPVLLPRYKARECELGADYPLFWTAGINGNKLSGASQSEIYAHIKRGITDASFLADLRHCVVNRAEHYRFEKSAERLRATFNLAMGAS